MELTRDQMARLRHLQLLAAKALAHIEKKPDSVGMERFGEDKWIVDQRAIVSIMVRFGGYLDGSVNE